MSARGDLRIALVYLGRRGAGPRIARELARGLAGLGPVRAFLAETIENRSDWEASGCAADFLPTFQGALGAAASLAVPLGARRAARAVAAWQPDALVFPMLHPWHPLIQRLLPTIPSLVLLHDAQPHPGLADRALAWLEDRAIRQAAAVGLLSEAGRAAAERRGARNVFVLPHGPLHYPPAQHPLSPTAPTVLFFGRITPYKGMEVLLAAWPAVRRRVPDARLLIAGEGDLAPYRAALEAAEGVAVTNRWIADDEVCGWLARAHVLALPYTSASQSGVIAAAAGCGTGIAVAASAVGGLPEQIQDGRTGRLLPPGDPIALADALVDLLKNPTRAWRLGAALAEQYGRARGWDEAARRVHAVCAAVVGERR